MQLPEGSTGADRGTKSNEPGASCATCTPRGVRLFCRILLNKAKWISPDEQTATLAGSDAVGPAKAYATSGQ